MNNTLLLARIAPNSGISVSPTQRNVPGDVSGIAEIVRGNTAKKLWW